MAKPIYHDIQFTEKELDAIQAVIGKYLPFHHSDPYALSYSSLSRIQGRIRKQKKAIERERIV